MAEQAQTPEQVATELRRRRELRAARKRDRLERQRERMERAQFASDLTQSSEARSLRVQRTRPLTLMVLMPVFTAFAAWSTAGVHSGAAAMTGAAPGSAMWWALWALEPALLGTVAWIILCRARLASAGGTLGRDADRIMWGCLGVSILLNAVGHWPGEWSAQACGALAAHSLGPLGAATTAHLIGVIETAITEARPSDGATPLAKLRTPEQGADSTSDSSRETTSESASESGWIVPPGSVQFTATERSQETSEGSASSHADQPESPGSEEAPAAPRKGRRERADKGTRLPSAMRGSTPERSPRAMSDEELADQLDTAIRDARLAETPSVSAVQKCLSVGFDRAKRVLALQQERTETVAPAARLSVVDDPADDGEEGAA